MENLTFTMTVAEANILVSALGNMPYAQVADIIKKMQEQAQAQVDSVKIPQTAETE